MEKDIFNKTRDLLEEFGDRKFGTILADPPWRFKNRRGKWSPESKHIYQYPTMALEEIMAMPVKSLVDETAHLYLWIPNGLLNEGLRTLEAWGFNYKTNLVWHKICKDGRTDPRGVGLHFRSASELILFGTKGKNARTLEPGRRQVNLISAKRREHSVKPDEFYKIIESCSNGPYLELFARGKARKNWSVWGNQAEQ